MKLLRMREARPKRRMELEERMRRLLFTTMIPMTCLMILLLIIFWHYAEPPCIVKLSVKAQGQNLKLQGFLKSVSSLCVTHR